MSGKLELEVKVTDDFDSLAACEHMVIYLNSLTWTSGETSAAFAAEVRRAMSLKCKLLLAHEMIGLSKTQNVNRYGCEFASFFACERGATPGDLIGRGIYAQIAVALKGGAWREPSLVTLGAALEAPPFESPRPLACDRHCRHR